MAVEEDRETTLLKIGLVQLIIGVLLTFSLINQQRNLTLLLLILLAFVYGARLWSRFSLAGLTAVCAFDRARIFPGEEVRLTISAENPKLLPVWLQVIIPVPGELHDGSALTASVREQGLLWFQTVIFNWRLVPRRRGIYRLGPPRIVVGDLMGIYPREMVQNGDLLDLIVYPRLVPLRPFAQIKKDLFGSPGAKSPVEDPIYLLGTREYQAGRPSRYIHWTASARLNRLQERVFEPSCQARVLFVLDVTLFVAEKAADLFEQSLEGLASLAVECDRQGFAVGLATNGTIAGDRSPVVAVARSAGQATLILETLAGIEMKTGEPLAGILRKLKGVDSGLSCVLFALYREESLAESPAMLRQKNVPVSTVYCSKSGSPGIDRFGAAAIALDTLLLQEGRST